MTTQTKEVAKESEIWKDIDGYEGFYQVSSFGRVRSLSRVVFKNESSAFVKGKAKFGKPSKNGYERVNLFKNNKCKTFYNHRLVAKAFIPNPQNHKTVNHINGNKTDNRLENLEWCSLQSNISHAYSNSLMIKPFGEKCNFSKMDTDGVLYLRLLHQKGVDVSKLERLFPISKTQVKRILQRECWSHI